MGGYGLGVQRFVSRASRMWRIVLILVVIGASNVIIALIQMINPALWRKKKPGPSRDAHSRH